MTRADRRRADRTVTRQETRPGAAVAPATAAYLGENSALLLRVAFVVLTGIFLVALARAVAGRITWYLAVDQFGYLQFANDLLHGKVLHEWEPARLMGILPPRTDILAQTYVWDHGRMYCRYSPGFPMLVAGWIALFGEARVSLLNPTIYLTLLTVAIACEWRLSGSVWRGLVVAVLIALCPTMMYWWSLTLTRDLSAHLFAFTGLYQLIPRDQPLTPRRAIVAGLALGFAGSIRNDAVLYLIPAALLAGAAWMRERPTGRRLAILAGGAVAGLVLGLLPTLSYNTLISGNPFRPSQGMEIENFVPSAPPPMPGTAPRVAYPSLWKGSTQMQVSGGGLQLRWFPRTAPAEWMFVYAGFGSVLIGLAVLGAIVALVRRPAIFLFAVPYAVSAFLLYSCWFRPDRRYIIGVFSMIPFLIAEGIFGSIDLLHLIASRRGEAVARPIAAVVALLALLAAFAPIPLPPATADSAYLSKGVLPMLTIVLPLALALGAAAVALAPMQRVTPVLAPALALVLVGFGTVRADATRVMRAPFQGPEATRARENLRKILEPRSIVITSEDMGRPAENVEYYGGFPAFYLTDLERWKIKPSAAVLSFISGGMRPYLLLIDRVPRRGDTQDIALARAERARIVAELADHGFVAESVLQIDPAHNMDYFVAAPIRREAGSELLRISNPAWEELLRGIQPKR